MNDNVKRLTRGAMIAAIYCVLTTVFAPISFSAVQFRVAEALTVLPVLTADAVLGLFVGCLLANIIGMSTAGASIFDVVFGSLATLIAAVLSRKLRRNLYVSAMMPALINGLIVGPMVYFCYEKGDSAFSLGVLLFNMLTVALGEVVVCYTLGILLAKVLERANEKHHLL